MLKNFFVIKKHISASAFLTLSWLISPLYASDADDSRDIGNPPHNAQASTSLLSAAMGEEKCPDQNNQHGIDLAMLPPELYLRVFSSLTPTDLGNMALSNIGFHTFVRAFQRDTDPRSLKDKLWVDGDDFNTADNYLINSVFWKMGHALLKGTKTQDLSYLDNIKTLMKGGYYLEERFPQINLLQRVIKGFLNPTKYLENAKFFPMGSPSTQLTRDSESDLIALFTYAEGTSSGYAVSDPIIGPVSLLDRYHLTHQARWALMHHQRSAQEKVKAWETVLKYDLDPITVNDMRRAGDAHYHLGCHAPVAHKLASFFRALQLYSEVLEKMAGSAQANDIRKAAALHFQIGQLHADPKQKLFSFLRAAQLYDDRFTMPGVKFSEEDIKNAQEAHAYVAQNAVDLRLKTTSLQRAQALLDGADSFEEIKPRGS